MQGKGAPGASCPRARRARSRRSTPAQLQRDENSASMPFSLAVGGSGAFKQAGRPDVQEALVQIPRIERGKGTLKDLLQKILTQVNATYQVVEDVILVIPGKPR